MRNGTVRRTFGTLVCCLVLLGCRSSRPWGTIIHENDPAQTRAEILKRVPIGAPISQAEAFLVKNGFSKMEDPSKWPKPTPGTAPTPGGTIPEDAAFVTYRIEAPAGFGVTRIWNVQLCRKGDAVEDIKVSAGGLTGF